MLTFPLLQSRAVCQYPVRIVYGTGVEVLRFVDGSQQRFLRQGKQTRRWQIRLDLLTDLETVALEDFFDSQLGSYSKFAFPDPQSGHLVPNCCLGNSVFTRNLIGGNSNSTALWVIETYG